MQHNYPHGPNPYGQGNQRAGGDEFECSDKAAIPQGFLQAVGFPGQAGRFAQPQGPVPMGGFYPSPLNAGPMYQPVVAGGPLYGRGNTQPVMGGGYQMNNPPGTVPQPLKPQDPRQQAQQLFPNQQQLVGGILGRLITWLNATPEENDDDDLQGVTFTATNNGNMCCTSMHPGAAIGNENVNDINYKVAKLLRIVPSTNVTDARNALKKYPDLDEAACYLIDLQTQKAAATQEAQALCQTVYQFFPNNGAPAATSSYLNWGDQTNQLGNTMAAAQMVAPYVQSMENRITPTGRKKALLVGCRYTGTRQQLSGPVQDVERIKRFLVGVYGFKDTPTTMVTLADDDRNLRDPSKAIFIPTKKNIFRAMEWLAADLRAGDAVFFYYSGHGSQKPAREGRLFESDGMDETILPVDFKTSGEIRDDELAEKLAKMPAGVRAMCMMDCCHSGSGMDLPYCTNFQTGQWKTNRVKFTFPADITLISGCRSDQTSADLSMKTQKAGGAMTMAWLAACAQNPFGLTFRSLLRRMGSILSDRGFTQIIEISSSVPFDMRKRPFRFDDITSTR